ncbi:secondary thiamine-phosphate synthase enzyme YjbQ [Geoalkalibacter halelectricus]|uniref:Secondary thiamine-phosphate synthase enzyme YjbQ n=1 Tax=Geoalkalibacter halelectricus TaxID=2847045 RepID=A0ABY5ZQL8_9BACT|nr:secondary thiamine-phosphate synthase enzyme YjbQ [Geoalkalibacter halelectricus]MDO3379223.1 secondary thiamine-phosphate synthase enzyme YjbQ [Geoalkalibacter halelectricus]UWZ80981.1 secondary thiamine-phosphate synthase enzyme YjbQ [Geoalkalibacter halelectricus]
MKTIDIRSRKRTEMIEVTAEIRRLIAEAGIREGIAQLFVPHTTAAVTINENADPDVVTDLLAGLERLAPAAGGYRHAEGNSDAHIKSTLVGAGETLLIENGAPLLGTWQGVYFCEFDGPRQRRLLVKILPQ